MILNVNLFLHYFVLPLFCPIRDFDQLHSNDIKLNNKKVKT